MINKKIAIVLPDGVGIRNYMFSSFFTKLKEENFEIYLLHSVSFNAIKEIKTIHGDFFKHIKLPQYKESILQKFLRELICLLRLKNNIKITANNTLINNWKPNKKGKNYFFYKVIELMHFLFLTNYRNILCLENIYDKFLNKSISNHIVLLKDLNINIVFNLHQRSIISLPLIHAAKTLKIRNIGAIYSWDNVPKAKLNVKTDEYIVWSEHMKNEMQQFYPEIKAENISITGTPQFEFYHQKDLIVEKKAFFQKFGLDIHKRLICFSGDDTRTSPFDPNYLEDLVESIMIMPENERYQILLRRCPVDISGRFDSIVNKYKSIIKEAPPIWNFDKEGDNWQLIYPNYKDIALLVNTVFHSDVVINVGSTMAHDFAMFNKPAIYLNYNPVKSQKWNIEMIYKFQHFKSMNNLSPVYWLNSKDDTVNVLNEALNSSKNTKQIIDGQKWLDVISNHRKTASQNIANHLNN